MNTKKYWKTEKSLRAFFRKYQIDPDTLPVPNFEKFKREYLDKMAPITEEERKSIMERNRQLLLKRARKKRMIVSMAACAVVAVGVVGGAYWLGRENAVVPNPSGSEAESVAVESDSTSENSTTVESTTDTSGGETSVTHLPGGEVTYEEAVQLTGLPLVKADEMDGFEGYRIDISMNTVVEFTYYFQNANAYIYFKDVKISIPSDSNGTEHNGRMFYVTQSPVSETQTLIAVDYLAENNMLYTLESNTLSADECIKLLDTLIM